MKKAVHQLLSFLMVLVMLFDAAPISALAEGDIAAETEAIQPVGDTPLPRTIDFTEMQTMGAIAVDEYRELSAEEYTIEKAADPSAYEYLTNWQPKEEEPAVPGEEESAAVPSAKQQVKGLVAYDIQLAQGTAAAKKYGVAVPVGVDMLADYRDSDKILTVDSVSYQLFHVHTDENGETAAEPISAEDVTVEDSDGQINSFFFKVDSFSAFVLTYAVEFTCIDTIGKLQINLENLVGSVGESLRVVRENDQYVTVLNVAGMLAESSVPESEDDADAAPCQVTLLNGTAKEAFDSEFWANAAAESSADGVEIADGSIRLTGDVELATVAFTTEDAVLTLEIAHYTQPAVPVVPETTDGFAYRFEGETANAADILAANEIVSSYYKVLSVSDESLVVPGEDGVLTAQDYFDELLLTLSLSPYDDTEVQIRLTNPAPAEYTYRAKEENVLLSDVFAALKITAEIESVESSSEKIVISSTKADAASTENGEKPETEETKTEETKTEEAETEEAETEEAETEEAETEEAALVISGDGDLLVTVKDGSKLIVHIIAPAPAVKGEVEATAAGAKAITIAFDENAGLPATAKLTAEAVTDENDAFAQYKDLAQSLAQSAFEQAELEKAQVAPMILGEFKIMAPLAAPLTTRRNLINISNGAKGEADYAEDAAASARGAVTSAITKTTTQTEVAGVFELTLQDTAFEEGDNELQPKEAVTVSLELDQTLPADSTVYAIHFYTDEDGEPQQDAIPASAQSSTEGGTLVSFPAESFSVYAITYTVGLYSGGYTHHLMVGQSITLSKLFTLFNLDKISEVASVEFSDPELMTVEALENDWLLTCLDHFDPSVPQTLTVTLLNGEVYTIDVADAGITQQYVAADGETYEINVKFGADAQLPVDAVLSVEEIGPEHEKYQDYLAQALTALGVNAEPAGEEAEAEAEVETTGEEEAAEAQNQFARFFDISIMLGTQKVQPQANVTVSIKLADAPEDEELKVVHFDAENGLVVMQTEAVENGENENTENAYVWFETESFSVYGVIVARSRPSGVNDLDGQMCTISHTKNNKTHYIKSTVLDEQVDKLGKTENQSEASVWQFEFAGVAGQYYISTIVDGVKQYMHLDKADENNANAHGTLSDTPQQFTIEVVGDGLYRLYVVIGNQKYYLNEFNGGNGFAGWHSPSDADDKMALNFTSSAKPIEQYMLVTEYEGELYIVLNDGRLEKAEKGPYGNPIGADFTTPMTWTWDGSHLFHNSLAVGYTSDQRASDFYRRYIDPNSNTGLTQEHGKYDNVSSGAIADPQQVANEHFNIAYVVVAPENSDEKHVVSRMSAMNETSFSTSGNSNFKIYDNGNYLGVVRDEDGTLRLQGNESEEASSDFWFADITNVSNGNSYITLEKVTHPVDGEQYYVVIKRTGDWGSVYYQIINPDRSIFATSTAQYDNTIVFATPDQSIPMWTYNGTEDACQISCNEYHLNPYNSDGITTTQASDNSGNQVIVDNEANSDFNNSQVRGRGPKFFKIDNNMLTGACGANDREEVFLAKLKGANDMDYVDSNLAERQHMVNHIDISIEGVTNLTVPLAYGTYYFKDPTTGEMRELNVTTAMDLNLSQNVPITEEDIKQGKIEAYVINPDGSYNYKNNLFTITGYSANEKTTFSTDQVRIEGNFKVADLAPVAWDEANTPKTRQARLNNKVYYNVSVTKPVTFWFVDPNRGQIYDADGEPMSITVDMTFSASFNYWDWNGDGQEHNNECPPLQPIISLRPIVNDDAGNYVADWVNNQYIKWQGDNSILGTYRNEEYIKTPEGKPIYHKTRQGLNNPAVNGFPEYCSSAECENHFSSGDWEVVRNPWYQCDTHPGGIAGWGNSGMDFVLGGDAGEANSRVVALNITKKVVDEQGNLISLKTPMTNQFDVYYKQYTDDAANGVMSYTNDSPFWNTITKTTQVKHDNPDPLRNGYTKLHTKPIKVGASGMSLIYDYAVSPGMFYIEEQKDSVLNQITDTKNQKWNYVGTYIETEYVWRDNNTAMRHVNNASRGKNDSDYKSIPDVLGEYKYTGYSGDPLRNGFLEFTVYNVYQPERVKIEVEKKWMANGALTTATEGAKASVTLRRYKLVHIQGYTEPKGSLTISDSFEGITGEQYGPTVYEITGPRLDRTLTYSDLTNGSITLADLMEGDYVIKKTAASVANKIASPITETKFVSVKREQTTTVEFQRTVYSDPSGEVKTVRVGVAIATDISNLDATPYNTGIVMDVPIDTVLQLNYGTFPYEPWGNNVQDPNWYVWEWTTSESWDVYHWEKVEQHKGHAVNASITITKPTCIMIEFGDVSAIGAMNISLVNPSAVPTGSRGMKLMAAPKRGAQLLGAAETVTIGYAASSEPPVSTVEGMQYVLDNTWTPDPIVLNSASGWKGSLLDDPLLDKADPETGYDYVYFISQVEENGVPANTQLGVNQDYAVVEREENGTNVLYLSFGMTNYMDSGSLSLEKHVQGVSNPDAVFWFTVDLDTTVYNTYPAEKTLADGTTKEQLYVSAPRGQIKVKLKDGEKIEIKGIPAGTTYTITEDDPSQAGYTPGLQTNTRGTITAGGKADAVMHNEFYTETLLHIEGTKVFTNGTIQENQFSFTISSPNGAPLPANTTVNADTQGHIDFGNITYTLAQLRNSSGGYSNSNIFRYIVKENLPEGVEPTEADTAAGYKIVNGIRYDLRERTVTVNVTYDNSTGKLTVTANPMTLNGENDRFVNESVATVTVTKEWKKKDGTTQAPPTGTVITLNLYKLTNLENAIANKSITLNGTADPEGTGEEAVYPTGNTATNYESASWVATWTNLPKKESDGTDITYVVKEAAATYGYTVSYSGEGNPTFASNNGTITNTLNETDIRIVKKDATDSHLLPGASFQLFKVTTETTGSGSTIEVATSYPNPSDSVKTTGANGEITFSNLLDGTYKLVETQAPAGYIMLSAPIRFTITNGVVENPNDGVVIYTAATAAVPAVIDPVTSGTTPAVAAVPATFTIPNTPGVILPSTGGPGTLVYTVTGLTLTLGAALWLILIRRKREQN